MTHRSTSQIRPALALPAIPLTSTALRLSGRLTSIYLMLAFALLALLAASATPALFPVAFLTDGGPIENSTVLMCLAAVACVLLTRIPMWTLADKVAICTLLLALAAHESNLHETLFGANILRAAFYATQGSAPQVLAAVLLLALVSLSTFWLTVRSGAAWARGSAGPVAITVLTLLAALLLAKIAQRAPVVLVQWGVMPDVPAWLGVATLSVEEFFELLMPLLAILAVVQLVLAGHQPQQRAASGAIAVARAGIGAAHAHDWSVRVHIEENAGGRFEPHLRLEAACGTERHSCTLPPPAEFDTPEAGTAFALEWVAAWQSLNDTSRRR